MVVVAVVAVEKGTRSKCCLRLHGSRADKRVESAWHLFAPEEGTSQVTVCPTPTDSSVL